jgi:glycosyltransferase involved in cell wall biosynthesis
MNKKAHVLMVGPLERAGGVAAHTRHIAKALIAANSDVILHNSSSERNYPRWLVNIIKIYNRTLGLLFFSIRKRNSFDIMHVQASGWLAGFLNAITGTIVISILREKKLVVTFHHSNTKEFLKKHKNIVEFVLRKADKLILVSDQQKKAFGDTFPNLANVQVISNGYDPSSFKPLNTVLARRKLNLPEKAFIIVNIANLEEYKGQKYLIKSMKCVLASCHNVMLYVVGKGSLMADLQSLIQKCSCNDSIIMVGGNKPLIEIPLWMNACDIFVLPSLSEGTPIVMFEALGCGKPFVGTNVGGIPEIIINENLGILVEPRDVN